MGGHVVEESLALGRGVELVLPIDIVVMIGLDESLKERNGRRARYAGRAKGGGWGMFVCQEVDGKCRAVFAAG